MKKNNMNNLIRSAVISAFVAATVFLATPAYCANNSLVLLVQQSPVQGGIVTPGTGAHKFEPGSEVVLTAVPRPGYQFVCWIGDVGDTTANRTSVYISSPKIVIAVFERSAFEFLVTDQLPQGGGGGGLTRSPSDYANQGFSGGGGERQKNFPAVLDNNPNNDFPVPPNNEANDFPVPDNRPIPEPATILLLSLGCLGLVRKRRELTNKSL